MQKQQTGLTMTELLVVLAITGVMLTISVPPLSGFAENSQAGNDTSALMSTLLLARSTSATRNSMISICKIDPATPTSCDNAQSWQSGWISFEDVDIDGVRDAGETIFETSTGMSANASVTTGDYANVISYLPSGGITTNGSLNICVNGNVANTIIINATGRPRVAESVCP